MQLGIIVSLVITMHENISLVLNLMSQSFPSVSSDEDHFSICTDEDPSLRIENFERIYLRSVFTKLN